MEFVSDSEYITTLLLIPVFSAGLFLTIAFLEILEKYDEILFINKIHAYTNKDFIFPLIFAVLIGLTFYMIFFEMQDYLSSFPPTVSKPQPCTEFLRMGNGSLYRACIKEYHDRKYWSIWDLF